MEETCMETYSGWCIDLLSPAKELIQIEDIAHGLALQCRFNGACMKFYSVAQHSIKVAELLPPELQLEGLLHDAAEAYTGDITRPMKAVLGAGYLPVIEAGFNRVLIEKFNLSPKFPHNLELIGADLLLLKSEAAVLMESHGLTWSSIPQQYDHYLIPITPIRKWKAAERNFLNEFERLRRDK